MIVAWRSKSQQGIAKMGTMALGGIFLNTPEPPPVDSVLELLFEIRTGARVRARAMVCTSRPGQGMGVKFMDMRLEDRSRLDQFLKTHIRAGNIEADLRTEDGQVARPREELQEATSGIPSISSSWEMIFDPIKDRASTTVVMSPFLRTQINEAHEKTDRQEPSQAQHTALEVQSPAHEKSAVEEELKRYLTISEKNTYYGLLGIAGDCNKAGIKQSFYALARKFHPDRHTRNPYYAGSLQRLMGAITEAYSVLSREETRASYDRKLAHSHLQTEEEENTDRCFHLASNCRRDGNQTGAIFWFRKCVSLAPEVSKYHASLATSLATLKHFRREAVEHFQKAIELDQWDPLAYLQLGELYETMQLPWRAGPLYSKVLDMDPDHVVARHRLAAIDDNANKKSRLAMASLFSKKR
jgi:curved DNA-binding protein CbpA